jgi:UDP-N-acetylmuramyl pentapeptide phosphotransferase/UDP-N-acetylglucosamine-1-phosphate transferase
MGDVGSSSLGFLAAGLSLWADRSGLFPIWVSVLVFSPFVVDATATILRRAIRGERVWAAHRSHYYQRLVLLGWGHRRTVLCEYLFMMGAALSAVCAWRWFSPTLQLIVLLAWAAVYAMAARAIAALERQHHP